jgi:hypothetical protein
VVQFYITLCSFVRLPPEWWNISGFARAQLKAVRNGSTEAFHISLVKFHPILCEGKSLGRNWCRVGTELRIDIYEPFTVCVL